MLNYVRAELYKAVHRKYVYIYTAVIVALEVLLMGGMTFGNSWGGGATVSVMMMMVIPLLSVGLYLSIIVADAVFSEQYKNGTLKNEVSFGISRTRIYLGKLMVSAVVGVAMLAAVLGAYLLLCVLLLPPDEAEGATFALIGRALMTSLPLYFGALGLSCLCYFNVKSATAAAFISAGALAIAGSVFKGLAFFARGVFQAIGAAVSPFLLTAPFDLLSKEISWSLIAYGLVLGVGWLIATTVLGLLLFRKKEIN